MPRHPLLARLTPTLHIAHRGGAALAPENTLVAFRKAVERYGADLLEIDVQTTLDGVLVVFHDDTVDRCTEGAGPLSALTWDEVSRLDAGYGFTPDGGHTFPFRGQGVRVPRLEEALSAFPEVPFNVELKAGGGPSAGALARAASAASAGGPVEAFAATLRNAGAVGRVICGSEDDEVALALAEALPEACRFMPRQATLAFGAALAAGRPPPVDDRWHVLDVPWLWNGQRLVTPAFLRAAEAAGLWVNVWTVDEPEELRRLVDLAVGGIMTDRPDRLQQVLGSRTDRQ